MDVKEGLIAAKELISDEAKWTTGSFARTEDGTPVSALDSRACKWCAIGALQATFVGDVAQIPIVITPLMEACASSILEGNERPFTSSLLALNDYTGHANVMKMFDCTIAKVDADGR